MAFGDSDLPAFFADMGVEVQFNGVTVLGLLDKPTQIKLANQGFGGFETSLPELRLAYNAFSPMPAAKDPVVVDGSSYTVSESTAEGDGKIVCYYLKAA